MPATAVKGDMAGTMEQVETTKIIKTGDRALAPAPNKEEAPTSTKEETAVPPTGPKHLPKEVATGPKHLPNEAAGIRASRATGLAMTKSK